MDEFPDNTRGIERALGAALDLIDGTFVREVEPGEMVVLEEGREPVSIRYAKANPALCVFELIYFARPDSYMEGRNLYEARRRMGMIFQEYALVERLSVMENVLSGRLGYVGLIATLRWNYPPEDIAGAVLFLASDLAAYITGQVLVVDGGMVI